MAQKIEIIVAKSDHPADVLDAAADNIEAHPDLHNQWGWRNPCGTGGCLAGWLVEAHPAARWAPARWSLSVLRDVDTDPRDGEPIMFWAAGLLGLYEGDATYDDSTRSCDAYTLFSGSLSTATVIQRARHFARLLRDGVDPHDAATQVHGLFANDVPPGGPL